MLLAVGAVLATVVAQGMVAWQLPYPTCGFKRLTGLACPGCGGTRSLSAMAHLHVAEAFAWNPLVAATVLVAVGAAAAVLLDRVILGGRMAARVGRRWRWGRAAGWTIAGLVAVNWIYLIRTLP